MDAKVAAQRWADVWQRGWEARDTASIVALYAEGADYSSEPFRVAFDGRAGAPLTSAARSRKKMTSVPGSASPS